MLVEQETGSRAGAFVGSLIFGGLFLIFRARGVGIFRVGVGLGLGIGARSVVGCGLARGLAGRRSRLGAGLCWLLWLRDAVGVKTGLHLINGGLLVGGERGAVGLGWDYRTIC